MERRGSGCLWLILIKLIILGAVVLSRQARVDNIHNEQDQQEAAFEATLDAHEANGTLQQFAATIVAETLEMDRVNK